MAGGDKLDLRGNGDGWSLHYLEIANVHGFSHGLFSFVIVPFSTDRHDYDSPSAIASLSVFGVLLILSLALLQFGKNRIIRFAQTALGTVVLILLCTILVLAMVSKYRVVLSVQAFWICVALLYSPVCLNQLLGKIRIAFVQMHMRVRSALPHETTRATRQPLSFKQRFLTAFFPALLGPSQILLFGPYTVYAGNPDEFTVSFWSVLPLTLSMLLVTVAILLVVGFLCSDRLYRIYVMLICGLGLALWLQGNLFLGDYGPFDGTGIDWSQHSARVDGQVALWIGLPVLLALLGGRVLPLASFTSGILIALQASVVLLSTAQQAYGRSETRREWRSPPEAIFQFSRTQNIIHVILDGFQADIFREIVEEDEALRRDLDGFVFFSDHAGAFPTTFLSVPAMLTGAIYRNETSIENFIPTQLERKLPRSIDS